MQHSLSNTLFPGYRRRPNAAWYKTVLRFATSTAPESWSDAARFCTKACNSRSASAPLRRAMGNSEFGPVPLEHVAAYLETLREIGVIDSAPASCVGR